MSFVGKLLGKKKDDFGDLAFDAGLPPMQDATDTFNSSFPNSNFAQTGVPSTGVSSFMEKSGDDLTGFPPIEGDDSSMSSQQSYPSTQPAQQQSPQQYSPSTGQPLGKQLAHNYMQQQQQPQGVAQQPQEKLTAHSLEIINLKLDAIRSELSSISQRIEKIERSKTKGF